jgi:hypothetical protein
MFRSASALLAIAIGVLISAPGLAASRAGAQKKPDPLVVVSPSERVELSLDASGPPKERFRGRPTTQLAAYLPPVEASAEKLQPFYGAAPHPAAGELVATLLSNAAGGTRLIVENGYNYPIIYDAYLITLKGGQRTFHPTSICPVQAGRAGVESWPEAVVGIAMAHIQAADPAHLVCNDGSALSVTADLSNGADAYDCNAGELLNPAAPVQISIRVDQNGAAGRARAAWSLASATLINRPALVMHYDLAGDAASVAPVGLDAYVAVGLSPPPTAKTVSVHLLLDGEEKVVRPWRLYGQQMAAALAQTGAARPRAIAGMIPIVAQTPPVAADDGLRAFLAGVGRPGAQVEVRLIGDDGALLAQAAYPADRPPVFDKAVIDPLLARAAAKPLSQCQKLGG